MSSQPQLSQPAYTTAFMSAIASSITGVNVAQYPQPNGYHVYLMSNSGIIDNTTYVNIYNFSDQYQQEGEVTSLTFVAIFKNLASYEFSGIAFYTQVNGQDFMEVADFVFSSPIQKPANYALVLFITFSISTPLQFINPIQDVIQECESYCSGVNCNSVANNICKNFIPFSPFNLVFLYLLGVTVEDLEQASNVQQQIEQYGNCMNNCFTICASGNSLGCALCLVGCQLLLQQNPIAIFTIGNKITQITQLLPQGINTVNAVNVCQGKIASLQPQNFQTTLNVVSQSEVQYVVQFFLPNANGLFNALQILISTTLTGINCNSYSLGVLYFVGVPLPSGENFILTVTITQSIGGQSNGS
jgi:hypothetical protein